MITVSTIKDLKVTYSKEYNARNDETYYFAEEFTDNLNLEGDLIPKGTSLEVIDIFIEHDLGTADLLVSYTPEDENDFKSGGIFPIPIAWVENY